MPAGISIRKFYMFFIDTFFQDKPAQPEPVAKPVPAAEPVADYDPQLVAQLKADHRQLKEVFCDIGVAGKAGDLAQVQQLMGTFRSCLASHLRKEIGLFGYLEERLADDEANLEVMHGFRREMDQMGPVAVGMLAKYEGISLRPRLALSLPSDLALVAGALAGRIQREEEILYRLYEPPMA